MQLYKLVQCNYVKLIQYHPLNKIKIDIEAHQHSSGIIKPDDFIL